MGGDIGSGGGRVTPRLGWFPAGLSGSLAAMARTILLYALALALAAWALQWLEYRYLARAFSTEIYVALVALAFVALGLWAGRRLTPGRAPADFQRNDAAIRSLGLTARECEILELLASGRSNKEMARALGISPNTVKTHVARLYEKLEVQNRMLAVEKARGLALIR
jgi:DNA-binding CsgD family transcriptional regulator